MMSHDPSACLCRIKVSDSAIEDFDYVHFEEGMLQRKKGELLFPLLSIAACLDYFSIDLDTLNYVYTDTYTAVSWSTSGQILRRNIGDWLKRYLRLDRRKLVIGDFHHLAHAYTAVWPSGFKDASVLVIDGAGSNYETSSIYTWDQNTGFKVIEKFYGTGIGLLYTLVTGRLGFKAGQEGKTMGLAAFHMGGECYRSDLKGIDLSYFTDYSSIVRRFPSHSFKIELPLIESSGELYSDKAVAMAYSVQSELERTLLRSTKLIDENLPSRNLCFAGGVALNCSANEKILNETTFDDIFIQPNAGDSGVSFGLALIGIHRIVSELNIDQASFWNLGRTHFKKFQMDHSPSSDEVKHILQSLEVTYSAYDREIIANNLSEEKVVAFFQSGWEFGPRALGHRSFLASAKSGKMKEVLNRKIKHRELYRPFAPICISEDFQRYFISKKQRHEFMLHAVQANDYCKANAPAIVHVDGTARVQTASHEDGEVYLLLKAYRQQTGHSILRSSTV